MKYAILARIAPSVLLFASLAAPAVYAAPAPSQESLSSILAKHAKAVIVPGAKTADGDEQTTYTISAGGLTGSLQETHAKPHKMRVDMILGPLHETTADNGVTSWQQDSTGNVRVVRGAEQTENRAAASFSLESYDPIKDAKKGKVTLHRQREPRTGAFIIDVAPTGGTSQTIYLNPKTYLISKIIAHTGSVTGTVAIRSYKAIRGERLPAVLDISYAGLPFTVRAELKSSERLSKTDPTIFEVPDSAKDFEFLKSATDKSVEVPFTFDQGEVVVAATINNHPVRLLVDSGAGTSFITGKSADAIGLKPQGEMAAVGYGGSASSGIATKATIELPGLARIKGQLVYVIKDPKIAQALNDRAQVDGALGYDLFARFRVRIDYDKKVLTLTDYSVPFASAPGATKWAIRLLNKTPVATATVDGTHTGKFLVDTGDTGAVHLYTKFARKSGLLATASTPGARARMGLGIGGAVNETLTDGHTLTINKVRLQDVSIATISGAGVSDMSDLAGGVGGDVLSRFHVTFDYPELMIVLEPNSSAGPTKEVQGIPVKADAAPVATPTPPLLPATTALTLDDVLKRHIQAMGGEEALRAVHSTRIHATIDTGGEIGALTTMFEEPGREYEEDQIGILNVKQGYDGDTAWRRDSNGNTRLLTGDEIKDIRNQVFFDTNSYAFTDRLPGKRTLRPARETGTGNYIVDVSPEGGKPSTLFFDPVSFLIVKEQHSNDDVTSVTTFSDFVKIGSVLYPRKQHITNGNARYDVDIVATKIENNVDLADTLFTLPTVSKNYTFLKPGATSATIPFVFDDGAIGFKVRINGKSVMLLLDSGASGIALSQKAAKKLGLKQGGFLEARGYGGSTDLRPVQIDSLEIPGAVKLTKITAVAVNLPMELDQFLGQPVAGFVGYDLLSRFVVRIDFAHRKLTFVEPGAFQAAASDGDPIAIALEDDIPNTTAQLDNLPPARYLIDTGDVAALRFYGPYVQQKGLAKKYPKGMITSGGGIGGLSESRQVRINSFTIGGNKLTGVPADFSLDTKGGASQLNAGSIGSGLLSRFTVTFDYSKSQIYLGRNTGSLKPFNTRTTGAGLSSSLDVDGKPHFFIDSAMPEAPIAKADISPADELLKIDGQPMTKLGLTRAREILSNYQGKPAATLIFRTPHGRLKTIRAEFFDPLQ
ncbi:MAG: aspartyl protease family protein [Capsulimonas sp.]|uniref:aspartyl protease family protein n=1 Tax=Capsulimonas sp. TaxID=2494211 RepID=UPI0032651FAF